MKNIRSKVGWFFFAFFAIGVGLYPLIYVLIDRKLGLLASKTEALLGDVFWNVGFYGHIFFGGLALIVGWVQFSKRIRKSNLRLHRTVGKIYIIAALISGFCGLFIAMNATGGLIPKVAFVGSALIWLYTTSNAFLAIRKGNVQSHQAFMIFSYAVCFSAVTLRFWLPLLTMVFQDFIVAYRITSWLSWVPNIFVAYYIVRKKGLLLV
ncbi:DUF2306 domain-containing protein [Maribacter sp. ACAM166]|uniref:DUF2306 domain-containing protein n=1 Tax=Maribacter sp. ACAM166 TaxID=2508996 RepID=UPI0010FE1B78|nr:DUF2306 domain-containing protein [Maribacter sp. ACAM166]TLP82120.1 DUF2306 domain-containing protein [Maribacter sp. ACAM166]